MANAACSAGYGPTLADMQSLYDARPGGALNTPQDWPLDAKNYQDITAALSLRTQNRYVNTLNLRTGAVGPPLWKSPLSFFCRNTRIPAEYHTT
ncbi:adhesion domain-containing protein, partial [Salmonella enterica]|uniref:adhesion domain-containing protein n=1 Tax=Salmonella enterica TaxID=28901 RepID=UPI00398C7724